MSVVFFKYYNNPLCWAKNEKEMTVLLFHFSSWVAGIQKMMEYVQKKVDQLISQCPDYEEFTLKKQQWIASLEDHLDKVYHRFREWFGLKGTLKKI